EQRHRAALATIVGPEDDRDVLEGDDEVERPEDQRENPEDVVLGERHRVGAAEALLEGVERRRPDVAVDDTDGGERQPGERLARGWRRRTAAVAHCAGAAWTAINESTTRTIWSPLSPP